MKPLSVRAPSVRVARRVSCAASAADNKAVAKDIASGVAAAALAAVVTFGAVGDARADVAGLTPCSESKAYQKRESKQVKSLQRRMSKAS